MIKTAVRVTVAAPGGERDSYFIEASGLSSDGETLRVWGADGRELGSRRMSEVKGIDRCEVST